MNEKHLLAMQSIKLSSASQHTRLVEAFFSDSTSQAEIHSASLGIPLSVGNVRLMELQTVSGEKQN